MAWYSRENRRRNAIALGVGSVAFLALILYGPVVWTDLKYEQRERERSAARQQARDSAVAERKASRVVHVTERYDLSWPARDTVPALKMSIPVVEMGGWRNARNPEIKETHQGPHQIELVMPLTQEKRLAVIQMYRDEVALAEQQAERISQCAVSFLHRGRYVRVHFGSGTRCSAAETFSSETNARATDEATRFLERLTFETLTPPSVDMQVERARKAQADCKSSAAAIGEIPQRHSRLLCSYAVALGQTVLKQAPAEASEPMLSAMLTHSDRNDAWDYFYLEDILAALGTLGQADGPLAIAAHALRAKLRNDLGKPEIKQAKRESLDALFVLAPKLAADDPLQQVVHDAFPDYLDVDEATRLKMHEVARLWHEKAAAVDPASDLAHKTRFYLCRASAYAAVPEFRKQLGRCADDFLTIWQKHAASGQGMAALGLDEATLAIWLPIFHSSYAFASNDYRGGAEGVRRVDKFARTRIPPLSNPYVYGEIRRMEEMLAAKAGAPR